MGGSDKATERRSDGGGDQGCDVVVILATQDHARAFLFEGGLRYEYARGDRGIFLPARVKDDWGIDQHDADGFVCQIMNASERHGRVPDLNYLAFPELLAACEAALDLHEGGDPGADCDSLAEALTAREARKEAAINSMRAAIAKAKGGA